MLRFLPLQILFMSCFNLSLCFAHDEVDRRQAFENSSSREKIEALKTEVLTSFTLYGQPITPLAIRKFTPWLSDLAPSVVALDLNATVKSNQYSGEVKSKKFFGKTVFEVVRDKTETDGYELLGNLGENKVVVGSYTFSTTGTGVWANILVLKISVKPFYYQIGKDSIPLEARYQLLAELVGAFSVPDRGSYTLKGTILEIRDREIGSGTGRKVTVDLSALKGL